ncbi:hypothetical protein Tco_1117184 [Tanacetum coccineum]
MAQPQRQADVHQDELCPPNKRYVLMDANKKIDLDNPLCPNESKILANILQNHPLRFSIVASSSVPWIYLEKFWHTLKEDGSMYRLSFMLDRIELTLTLDDIRIIFQLPQATDNNHKRFVAAPKFLDMIMQMLYCFVNNVHVDYVDLLESLHDCIPKISQRFHDKYHNLEDDEMVKSIFNSGKNKAGVGMKIPSWMIIDEIKLTENYRMYAVVFGVDVPMTQSQPIKFTQGTHRTTSAPKTPNPDMDEGESNTIQLSIVVQKSHDDLEAKQNEENIKEHLMAEEIEKLVEGTENIGNDEVDNSISNSQNDPDTRLEPRSYKKSLEVEKIVVVSQPVNVIEKEDESAEDDYELRRREKGKEVEETRNKPPPTPTRSTRIHSTLISSDTEKLQELIVTDPKPSSSTPSSSSPKPTLSMSQHILSLLIHLSRTTSLKIKFEGLHASNIPCRPSTIRPRDQDDPYDDSHLKGENSAKRQKTSEHGTYVFGESSSGQVNESEPGPSTSGNQEQLDDFDFWTDSYATDYDEIPTEKVSQELVEEMSQTVDETKLRKVVDEMLRQ